MAWTKPITRTATVDADDVSVLCYFQAATDSTPAHLRMAVKIATDGGEEIIDRPLTDLLASLSAAQRTAFKAALVAARDAALPLLGYVQS